MPRVKYRKLEVVRQSGLPVKVDNLVSYQNEFRNEFDKLWDELKETPKEFEKRIAKIENDLLVKYPCTERWDWEMSQAKWKKIAEEYGPIAIVLSQAGKLVYIIMDQL